MYIYNTNTKLHYNKIVLNPDHHISKIEEDHHFQTFFRHIHIPQKINHLIGIYFTFEYEHYPFEKYPHYYEDISQWILELIEKEFHFHYSSLYHQHYNCFYIVTFNIKEEIIIEKYLHLLNVIQKQQHSQFQTKHIFFHCGVYMTNHLTITPHHFYNHAKKQWHHCKTHSKNILSLCNENLL